MDGDFLLTEMLNRIVGLKKRLDRLIFLLIASSVFAFANQTGFRAAELGGIRIEDSISYHVVIAFILTILFGMIGSHLIDYSVKRNKFDELAKDKQLPFPNSGESIEHHVSTSIVPISFYEFVYSLRIVSGKLRWLPVVALFLMLYASHFLSFYHMWIGLEDHPIWRVVVMTVNASVIFLCYWEFIMSYKRVHEDLGRIIKILILLSFGFSAIASFCVIYFFL